MKLKEKLIQRIIREERFVKLSTKELRERTYFELEDSADDDMFFLFWNGSLDDAITGLLVEEAPNSSSYEILEFNDTFLLFLTEEEFQEYYSQVLELGND